MKRTMDAAFFNEVANHPEVRPWLGGTGPVDVGPMLSKPTNYGFLTDFGGFVVECLEPGLYECHSMFLPEGRGGLAVQSAIDAIRFMFTATDCMEIVTRIPDGNRAAYGIGIKVGFEDRFYRPDAWDNGDGTKTGVTFKGISYWRWLAMDQTLPTLGQWFHERLDEMSTESGHAIPLHEDDAAHNRAVGASVLMFKAGNPVKAVSLYNRWARIAGYKAIALVSLTPPIIDIVDAVLTIKDGDMEILQCR